MTTEETHGHLWSRGARDWARFMEPHYRSMYREVHDRLGVGVGTHLLDVGCGPGGAALLASERGAQVAGLDASPGSIEVAHERLPDGDFRVGDMETLPWPDASFDAVTGFNSFQFAGSPGRALAEARRVLAPDGKLGIVVWAPPAESQQAKVMAATSALAPPPPPGAPGPFALAAPGALESAVESAGLRLLDQGVIPVVTDYPDVEAACRAMMAGSGATRAAQHSGEARVREVLLEALEGFRTESGGVRFHNRFRFLIAE
jgi:SAM-dependent methyltransferase